MSFQTRFDLEEMARRAMQERLSTDLTSLNQDADRLAVIIAYVVQEDGALGETEIYRARVRNQAKLAYRSITEWLEGRGPMPEALANAAGTAEQIRLQDGI